MMKNLVGVIDVGSNSVRLMLSENNATIEKHVTVTKLAEGEAKTGVLSNDAMERTLKAVSFFVKKARGFGAKNVYVFATAAVRSAKNGVEFARKIFDETGIELDIVSGEKEAKLGLFGALDGKDGAVIDVGGASTEIISIKNSEINYSKSLYIGSVNVTDLYGEDFNGIKSFLREKIKEYGVVPTQNFHAIGGTATSLAAICIGDKVYDSKKVHGYKLTMDKLCYLEDFLTSKTPFERENVNGLQKERAGVICSGLLILKTIMEEFGIEAITVSENDNLEGYLGFLEEKW